MRGTTRDGRRALEVITKYVWVYAFEGAGDRVIVVHDEVRWVFHERVTVPAGDRGMWVVHSESYVFGHFDRASDARGMFAPAVSVGAAPSGPPEDPAQYFDPNRSLDVADTCR